MTMAPKKKALPLNYGKVAKGTKKILKKKKLAPGKAKGPWKGMF